MIGAQPLLRDVRRFAALGPSRWWDFLVGTARLAQARLRLQSALEATLDRSAGQPPIAKPAALSDSEQRIASRIGFAVSRLGPRLPWRADCLVQAFAAQQWLARHHIATHLVIGARRDSQGFAAHAWLLAGDVVVTGGDIAGYTALTAAQRLPTMAFD